MSLLTLTVRKTVRRATSLAWWMPLTALALSGGLGSLAGCSDGKDAATSGAASASAAASVPTAEPTIETSALPNSSAQAPVTLSADDLKLVEKLIGRWHGPIEISFLKGGKYLVHAGPQDVEGRWRPLEVRDGKIVKVEVVLIAIGNDTYEYELVTDDHAKQKHLNTYKEGQPLADFYRVKDE